MRTFLRKIVAAVFLRIQGWLDPEETYRREFFQRAFRAVAFNGISGDYAEFGCWSGTTFKLAYRESRRFGYPCKMWAFDSFQGLPAPKGPFDEHPIWVAGNMNMSLDRFHEVCAANRIPRSAYETVPGFYERTLANPAAPGLPTDISLAFIDCDLYSSASAVLRFLMPRLKHGMILAFDDYFCWSSNQVSGERRASLELLGSHPRWGLVSYVQFGWAGMSFVVEDKQLLPK